jgi:hypothetical protein
MLITTYNTFVQSHSQVCACPPHVISPLLTHAVLQMLLMLQREAALVEEMRAAAAEFRKVWAAAPDAHGAFAHASSAPQRFEQPLRALQAARDSFHDSSAAQLPGSVIDNLPVRPLQLPLLLPLQLPATATCVTPLAAPASVRPVGARPQP